VLTAELEVVLTAEVLWAAVVVVGEVDKAEVEVEVRAVVV